VPVGIKLGLSKFLFETLEVRKCVVMGFTGLEESWFFPLGTKNVREDEIGGKAYFLGKMIQGHLPVPPGFVLLRAPVSESEWSEVLKGCEQIGHPKLAIRSSAVGEDSSKFSFAGQNLSFLEVDETQLRQAIQDCFESVKRKASVAYRQHFLDKGKIPESDNSPKMAVVMQAMVEAQYSGVFFSRDPRGEKSGWVLEVIPGFGEELVSGHQTPFQFCEGEKSSAATSSWLQDSTDQIVAIGNRVRNYVKFDLDMEWAKDHQDRFWIVQARPITSLDKTAEVKNEISREIKRLTFTHSSKTVWDCQTFSEWTGTPTPLSFNLWKHAFSASGSFGKALSRLGYLGTTSHETHAKAGVLEQVFGHTYVNLSYLSELYFGSVAPIEADGSGKSHLGFTSEKLDFKNLIHLPATAIRMFTVAWKLQTSRTQLIHESREKLEAVQANRLKSQRKAENNDPWKYRNLETPLLNEQLRALTRYFSEDLLESSFLLIIPAEATLRNLQGALTKIQGEIQADATLKQWMGNHLHTLSLDMDTQFAEACLDPEKQKLFIQAFGHRGPGELELSRPRWAEMGKRAFPQIKSSSPSSNSHSRSDLPEGISPTQLNGIYGTLFLQEWEILRPMLELIEAWKNELLRTYAEIRWICLELGARLNLGTDGIFWLRLHEIKKLLSGSKNHLPIALKLIERRKKRSLTLSRITLPSKFSLMEIKDLVFAEDKSGTLKFKGEGLSAGIAYGEVRVVTQPENADLSNWPDDVILVAKATDPGWTPLFLKAKAIIVEKGGVLSHCAIVARELGLPLVSGVLGCHLKFKNGEHVWVDGSIGSVRKA
jgi:phosphohistidine swiveling domain-containing protein